VATEGGKHGLLMTTSKLAKLTSGDKDLTWIGAVFLKNVSRRLSAPFAELTRRCTPLSMSLTAQSLSTA
jgi:hypothetical protein